MSADKGWCECIILLLRQDQVSVKESPIFCSLSAEETRSNLKALKADQSMLLCGS